MGVSGALALLAAVQVSLPQVALPQMDPVDADPLHRPRQLAGTPRTLRIGPQRTDLVRFNRVEGLSVGVRGQVRPTTPLGPLSVSLTARLGTADRHPNGRLDVAHESIDRRIAVSGYHELTSIDERGRHFGPANSLMGLLYGQDDGDYFRRSGATLQVTPPSARLGAYRVRAYAEYHESVEKETDAHLERIWDGDAVLRPNILADEGWEVGGSLELGGRTSSDPYRTQAGADALFQAATGSFEYARAALEMDVALALPSRLRLVLEGGGGTSLGAPPTQRLWYVGGPLTLHAFDPRAAGGKGFGRGRLQLDRRFAFGGVLVFTDVAWAGEWGDFDRGDALTSAGMGVALVDGIVRIDGAWQLEGSHDFRLDIYLDDLP